MKRIRIILFLTIVMLIGFTLTAHAEASRVSDDDPAFFTIEFQSDNGTVTADGNCCGDRLIAQKQTVIVYECQPEPGYRFSRLYVNGLDVTDRMVSGQYTADPLTEDLTIRAVFLPLPVSEDDAYTIRTGDAFTEAVLPVSTVMILSGLTILLFRRVRRKHS